MINRECDGGTQKCWYKQVNQCWPYKRGDGCLRGDEFM
jgi:hypothetical protein